MTFKVKSLLAKVERESAATEAEFDRELEEECGDPFAELWDGRGSSKDKLPVSPPTKKLQASVQDKCIPTGMCRICSPCKLTVSCCTLLSY
jgi:hypothetical protein